MNCYFLNYSQRFDPDFLAIEHQDLTMQPKDMKDSDPNKRQN